MRTIALLLLIAAQSRSEITLGVSGSGFGGGCANAVASISPAAGSDLFVLHKSTDNTAPTTPTCTGATCTFTNEVQDLSRTYVAITLWRMRNIPAGITAVNVSGADCDGNGIVAFSVSGLAETAEVSAHGNSGWATTMATSSLTTTSASVLMLAGFAGYVNPAETWSSPTNSFTIVAQTALTVLSAAVTSRIVTPGTYSTALTGSSGNAARSWVFVGYPAAGGAPATAARRRILN